MARGLDQIVEVAVRDFQVDVFREAKLLGDSQMDFWREGHDRSQFSHFD